MSAHRDEHLDLCVGLALGRLAEDERLALEAHLAEGCRECEAELARLGVDAVRMAHAAPRLRAPAALRSRVLEAVRAEARGARQAERGTTAPARPARAPARAARWIPTLAWAAAAAALAVAGVLQWRAADDLRRKLAAAEQARDRFARQLEDEQRWATLPLAPQARVIELKPTPSGAPALAARVTYDPATRRAVLEVANFTPPTDKDYQLWAITKSGPKSLGLLRADRGGRAVIRLPEVGDPATLDAFAVSPEQRGGAPTPNAPAGPVVMVGKVAL